MIAEVGAIATVFAIISAEAEAEAEAEAPWREAGDAGVRRGQVLLRLRGQAAL